MIYPFFYKKLIFPIYHYLKRDNLMKISKELRENQWKSLDDIQNKQRVKLKKLLLHAYENVPYYRRVINKRKLLIDTLWEYDNFRQLPILSKDIIRENMDDLVSTNLAGNRLYKNSTSGSTGENLLFYTDKRSNIHRKASIIVNEEWIDFYPGDRKVRLWGAPMDLSKARSLWGRIHGFVSKDLFLSSYDLSPEIMDMYIRRIKKFKPKLFISYPGPLEVFAEYIKEKGITFPTIKAIITSAEQLFNYQRVLFEDVFKAEVFNRYGCREVADIAQECRHHCGLHLNADRVLIEILDDYDNPVLPGVMGELYITDLDNYGMPMIRYQIGDRASWSEKIRCPCDRGLPLLAGIEGRSMDVIKTPSNKKLGGTFWTILLKTRPGIKQFQIIQEDIRGIIVYYVPDKTFDKRSLKYFEQKIKEKCGDDFDVVFIQKDNIRKTASGKNRFIISMC